MTDHADTEETPRPLNARDRRIILWTIGALVVAGYLVVQLILLSTTKDAAPPSWVVQVPANASVVGEPRTEYSSFRAVTYLTIRPTDGRTPDELIDAMGLSEQPTQMGPTPLDWRPLWVYSRSLQGNVEVRLVYVEDSGVRVP